MSEAETADVTILTRVKAGGKVWPEGPATVPVDLLADLEAAGALADPPEPAADPDPQGSGTNPGTGTGAGAIEGLTDAQSQMLRNAVAGMSADQRTAGGQPKADAVNAALKQAEAGFAVKAAQIAAAMP